MKMEEWVKMHGEIVNKFTPYMLIALGSLLMAKGYISIREMDIAVEEVCLGRHPDVEVLCEAIRERLGDD